ncbi:MAG: hypothetical protein H7X93_00375, partial [Sphingomonadaceae bacterium]|nr:hypothetical protein [Sphingomonadaceae bacterium]
MPHRADNVTTARMTKMVTRREALGGIAATALLGIAGCAPAPRITAVPTVRDAEPILAAEADRLMQLLPETAAYNGVAEALDGGPLARRMNDYSPAGEAARRAAFAASET